MPIKHKKPRKTIKVKKIRQQEHDGNLKDQTSTEQLVQSYLCVKLEFETITSDDIDFQTASDDIDF